MGCLSTTARAAIIAEIEAIDALIVIVLAAYVASLTGSAVEEYRFDSGDGSQRQKNRKPSEIKAELDGLKSDRARLVGKLNGTGIVSLGLRRKNGRGLYGNNRSN